MHNWLFWRLFSVQFTKISRILGIFSEPEIFIFPELDKNIPAVSSCLFLLMRINRSEILERLPRSSDHGRHESTHAAARGQIPSSQVYPSPSHVKSKEFQLLSQTCFSLE